MTGNGRAQQIADHINCHGISTWLAELALGLDMPLPALLPEPPLSRHKFAVPGRGLHLVLAHPHAGHVEVGDPERWELTEAKFFFLPGEPGVWCAALPFDLDAQTETPESAKQKLSDETSGLSARAIAHGDRRIWGSTPKSTESLSYCNQMIYLKLTAASMDSRSIEWCGSRNM